MRFQPTAPLASLASRRLKRGPLGTDGKNFEKREARAGGGVVWRGFCLQGWLAFGAVVGACGLARLSAPETVSRLRAGLRVVLPGAVH